MASVAIIGGGPAGLSASIYLARAGVTASVFYKNNGALEKADKIENYFGFSEPLSGNQLLAQGRTQAERLGVSLLPSEVTGIEYAGQGFVIKTVTDSFSAAAVILATGSPRNAPKIKGIPDFEGRGISYCAVCDAFFYRGKDVAVLGQGNYALEEANTLHPVANSVTVLTNGEPAPNNLPEGILSDTRKVAEISGSDTVSSVRFADGDPLSVSGVFIAYGTAGSADFARKLGAQLNGNRILADGDQKTNVPGLFAAGDCTGGLLQIAKAAHEGAAAAMSAISFLRKG